jgi:holin-like protein
MPVALTILVGAQLAGEVLRRLLHLPLPGPVIGMFILAVALLNRARGSRAATQTGPTSLEKTATVLISNMGLMFVPAGVGIVAELGVLRSEWLPIVAGVLVSTVLGLIVTGVVMHRITGRAERDAMQAKKTLSSREAS